MKIIFALVTILGFSSDLWLLWRKISSIFNSVKFDKETGQNNLLSLPDEEFTLLAKIIRIPLKNSYFPISEKETNLCNSLINYGWLKSSRNSSYKLARERKRILRRAQLFN